ncbi:MAG: hypothetical protein WC908_02330 [Candidatus Paceibacterota bacterium]
MKNLDKNRIELAQIEDAPDKIPWKLTEIEKGMAEKVPFEEINKDEESWTGQDEKILNELLIFIKNIEIHIAEIDTELNIIKKEIKSPITVNNETKGVKDYSTDFIKEKILPLLEKNKEIDEIISFEIKGIGKEIRLNIVVKSYGFNIKVQVTFENKGDGVAVKDDYIIDAKWPVKGKAEKELVPQLGKVSEMLKMYIEKEGGKKIEKIWIEDGKLKALSKTKKELEKEKTEQLEILARVKKGVEDLLAKKNKAVGTNKNIMKGKDPEVDSVVDEDEVRVDNPKDGKEKKQARDRKLLKAVVGGAIIMASGYFAYYFVGNKRLPVNKDHNTAVGQDPENKLIKTYSYPTGKSEEIIDTGTKETKDVTVKNSENINQVEEIEKPKVVVDTTTLNNQNISSEKFVEINNDSIKTPDVIISHYSGGVLGRLEQAYDQNIKHLFPNNINNHAWDNVKGKSPNDLFKLEKEGGLNEMYKPLAVYLHKLEITTGLSPENETTSEYMNRGLEKAYEMGRLKNVELLDAPKIEVEQIPSNNITPEEIFKITGVKELNVGELKDWENIIKGYEADGYKDIYGQLPFKTKMDGVELKELHAVAIENNAMTQEAVKVASNAKMDNVMELINGKEFYDYYLEKITPDKRIKLIHIKFYK